MTLLPLAPAHHAWARQVYEASFPESVRAAWDELVAIRADEEFLVLTDDSPVAFVLLRHLGPTDMAFLRYVAVDPRCRGAGVGSRLIQAVSAHLREHGYEIILLDVEDPGDEEPGGEHREEHLRRIVFYERLGFSLLPLDHYAPPAHGSTDEAVPLLLLGNGTWDSQSAAAARSAVYAHRYGVTSS